MSDFVKIQSCYTKLLILSISRMKKFSFVTVLTIAAFALGSCNTFIGAGKDLKGLGTGIENKGTTGSWNGTGVNPATAAPSVQNPYGVPSAQ